MILPWERYVQLTRHKKSTTETLEKEKSPDLENHPTIVEDVQDINIDSSVQSIIKNSEHHTLEEANLLENPLTHCEMLPPTSSLLTSMVVQGHLPTCKDNPAISNFENGHKAVDESFDICGNVNESSNISERKLKWIHIKSYF